MSSEVRVFGIPGGGKTRYLSETVLPSLVKKYGPDKVIVTSFSRTGAKEIAMRSEKYLGDTINPAHVGTIHSLCWKMLDQPEIAELHIDQWNDENPTMQLEPTKKTKEPEVNLGDKIDALNQLNILRAKLIDPNKYPDNIQRFANKWQAFKDHYNYLDFTDIVDVCLQTKPYGPDNPQAIVDDEAQDTNDMQIALLRSWAKQAQILTLAGDDQQCLFSFSGCSPQTFLTPAIDDKYKRKLERSYRCPKLVLERAVKTILKVKHYEPKQYLPRIDKDTGKEAQGQVIQSDEANYKNIEPLLNLIQQSIKDNKSIMLLASCAYMITPIRMQLMEHGLPFGNKYKKDSISWNPLGKAAHGTSATELLYTFQSHGEEDHYWSVTQLLTWIKHIKVGDMGLKRKVGNKYIKALKQALKDNPNDPDLNSTKYVLNEILSPAAIEPAINRNVTWFHENVKQDKFNSLKYPIRLFKKYGKEILSKEPKILIGTGHSVKGGQADTVIVFPDISMAARMQAEQSQEGLDSLFRLFYVMMTRAYDTLVIANHTSDWSTVQKGLYVNI